ncbi:hypothetical protein BJX76DRAFT_367633 [Aspergillus varians]
MASITAKSSLFEKSSPFKPSSSVQWKFALQELKLLYNQQQYKRCVARSSSILSTAREPIHPVYRTYLYFYSAMSYETMGRHSHDYSSNKIPLLNSALDSFATCLAVLPDKIPVDRGIYDGGLDLMSEYDSKCGRYGDPCTDTNVFGPIQNLAGEVEPFPASDIHQTILLLSRSPSPLYSPCYSPSSMASGSTSPTESIVTSITDIIDKTLDCPDEDPFLSDYEETIDIEQYTDKDSPIPTESAFEHEDNAEHHLIPSPLHVRKPPKPLPLILPSVDLSGNTIESKTETGAGAAPTTRPRPPPLPLPVKAMTARSSIDTIIPKSEKHTSKRNTDRTPYAAPSINTFASSAEKYNNSLTFLHTQITSTITTLHTLIHDVTCIQNVRASSRRSFQRSVSFWSFSPASKESGFARDIPLSQGVFAPASSSFSSSPSRRESIQDRIIRLRAEGWETVGIRNRQRGWKGVEYYQEFCGMVLDELYLG